MNQQDQTKCTWNDHPAVWETHSYKPQSGQHSLHLWAIWGHPKQNCKGQMSLWNNYTLQKQSRSIVSKFQVMKVQCKKWHLSDGQQTQTPNKHQHFTPRAGASIKAQLNDSILDMGSPGSCKPCPTRHRKLENVLQRKIFSLFYLFGGGGEGGL